MEVNIQGEKAKKIAKLNEELRELINQERNAYNEDRGKMEEECAQLQKSHDMKIKLIRNKLLVLLAGDSQENTFDHGDAGIDEVIRKV